MSNACAVHAGNLATFTCSRCGSFACDACVSAEADLCAACDRRRGSVLGLDVSAGGLLGDSFRLVARFITAIAIFSLVETVAETALGFVTGAVGANLFLSIPLMLVGVAVKTVIQASWITLLASAAHGTPLASVVALQQGAGVALYLFVCNLLVGLAVAVGLVLLIIPGIVVGLGLVLAAPAVVVARRGPVEAMGDSWSLTDTHRVDLFLALLGASAVGFAALFVANLAINAALSLVPGASVLGPPVTSFLDTIILAPAVTVPVLAYLRLNRRFTA